MHTITRVCIRMCVSVVVKAQFIDAVYVQSCFLLVLIQMHLDFPTPLTVRIRLTLKLAIPRMR